MRKKMIFLSVVLAFSIVLSVVSMGIPAAALEKSKSKDAQLMPSALSIEVLDKDTQSVRLTVSNLLLDQYSRIEVALALANSKENAASFVATDEDRTEVITGLDFDKVYHVYISMHSSGLTNYCYGTLEFRYKNGTVYPKCNLTYEIQSTSSDSGAGDRSVNYETEPNDSITTAMRVYDDDTTYGRISSSSDIDYYKVIFTGSGSANFWLGDIPSGQDYDFYLYNEYGTLIEQSTTTNSQEQIYDVQVDGDTWYYMKVVGYNGSNSSSYYRVRAKLYPDTASSDSYEPNDTLSTAEWIPATGAVYANIGSTTDQDFYYVTLPNDSELTISLYNIPSGCDYDLELLNSSGARVGISANYDEDEVNIAEEIYAALDAGTYYIRVYSYSGYSSANYILSLGSSPIETSLYDYTVYNYVDQGFRARFSGGAADVTEDMNVVSALFEELFNLRISSSTLAYTSCADTCKIQSSGSVTVSNLASGCLHNSEHDSTDVLRSTLVSDKGRGNTIISRVLWTGHILDGNPKSNSVDNNSWTVIITPYHVTYGDNYSNKQDHAVRREYRFTLMHELSHQLDAPDHYCFNDENEHVPCLNPSCWYHLGELRPDCIMFSRSGHDMEADPVETLYCQDCIDTISDHLEDHH